MYWLAGTVLIEGSSETSSALAASAKNIFISVGILPVEKALSITINLSLPRYKISGTPFILKAPGGLAG